MLRLGISTMAFIGLLGFSLLVVTPQRVVAADPVEAFPDTAAVLLRFKEPTSTVRRTVRFASRIDEDFGETVQSTLNKMGMLISNPKGVGVDRDGDWWVAVFPHSEAPSGVVFAIPASNAQAMKQAIRQGGSGRPGGFGPPGGGVPGSAPPGGAPGGAPGAAPGGQPGIGGGGTYQFVEHGNYLLYTTDRAALQQIQGLTGGSGRSIKELIDSESNGVIRRGDVSVYVNVRQIKEVYKTELEAAREEIDAALNDISQFAPESRDINLEPIFEIYGRMFQGLLQGVEDTESFTAAVAVRRGIEIEEYLRVKSGSSTDRFLQSNAPSELAALNKLPPNKLMYFGLHGNTGALTKWAAEISTAMIQDNPELKKTMQEVLKAYQEVEFGSMVSAFGLGDLQSGAIQTVTITEAKPVETIRNMMRKSTHALGQLSFGGIKQEMELKPEAETYGEHSADILTVKTELDEQADPLGMQKQMMSALYGPEGMTQRMIYLDDVIVQTMGGGRTTMEQALESLEAASTETSEGSANSALQATRSQLADQANLMVFMDIPGLVSDAMELASSGGGGQMPLPLPTEELKQLSAERSYLGFSLATEPGGVRAKTHIPRAQIEGIYKLGTALQGMFQQFQPGPPGAVPPGGAPQF